MNSHPSYFSEPYELLHADAECKPDDGWEGTKHGVSGCNDICRSKGFVHFLIAPDRNCKCCFAGDWKGTYHHWTVTRKWLGANIYGPVGIFYDDNSCIHSRNSVTMSYY